MAEKNKKGLGRGIEAILGQDAINIIDEIESSGRNVPGRKEIQIEIDDIRANPYQPRKVFDEKALNELAESIKIHGIFTPLIVRESIGGYELIAGERRLRAAKIAGLETVPAVVVKFSDEDMMEVSLLENIQREDLNPIEEAIAYDNLIKRLGYTQEKLAQRVGKSREYCANMLRLLKLPSEIQKLVANKKLTMGHVRPLLTLEEDEMYDVAMVILERKLSVRDVEAYVKSLKEGKKPKKAKVVEKDPWIKDLEYQMSSKLGTRVEISKKALTIQYADTHDLNRILEIIGCLEEES